MLSFSITSSMHFGNREAAAWSIHVTSEILWSYLSTQTHQCGYQLHMHENGGLTGFFCLAVNDASGYSCQCCHLLAGNLYASLLLAILAIV